MKAITFSLLLTLILFSCKQSATKEKPILDTQIKESKPSSNTYKTIGELQSLDPRFAEIVKADAKIEVLAEGYEWSEGPLWLESEQMLIWSDVPKNTIYSWKEGEAAKVYLQPSGYTSDKERGGEPGSNGLLLNSKNELVLCQHGDRQMAKMNAPLSAPKADFETIATQYDGQRFNSPNDAAYGQDGNLYFTDPPYGLEKQHEDPAKETPFQGVYRVAPDGKVFLMTKELTRPNGIALSPDFKKCYVANSDHGKALWMVYEIDANKNFTNGKVFFDATTMVPNNKGLPDGLKVNKKGIVFATGPGGVYVFSPEGKHLGTISTGQATSNCALNTDESVLYMTSDMLVTRIQLQ
ncbi:MAG: SMP-30/gluconolactonase/LRE family protein [Chitinophagales bacterium]